MNDFRTNHLNDEQKRIADSIVRVLGSKASGGGCRAFYSPEEWTERGEDYGANSKLVLVHDGGDLARFCNYDHRDYEAINRLDNALREIGYYVECCTCWYSAVYPI